MPNSHRASLVMSVPFGPAPGAAADPQEPRAALRSEHEVRSGHGRSLAIKRSDGVPVTPTEGRRDPTTTAETAPVTGSRTDADQLPVTAGPRRAFSARKPRLRPRQRRCDRFPVTGRPQIGHAWPESGRNVTVEWAMSAGSCRRVAMRRKRGPTVRHEQRARGSTLTQNRPANARQHWWIVTDPLHGCLVQYPAGLLVGLRRPPAWQRELSEGHERSERQPRIRERSPFGIGGRRGS